MSEQPVDADVVELGHRLELQRVQPPLPGFDFRDERLGFTEGLGDLDLRETLGQTALSQAGEEGLVVGRINALHIAYPRLEYQISHFRIHRCPKHFPCQWVQEQEISLFNGLTGN